MCTNSGHVHVLPSNIRLFSSFDSLFHHLKVQFPISNISLSHRFYCSWPNPSHIDFSRVLHPKISSSHVASRRSCQHTAGLRAHPHGQHRGQFFFSLKRLKPEIFLQDGRAGQKGFSQSVLLYHWEQSICSLHIIHALTLSTTQTFIHLDASGSSRWLGNACLSLPLSKLLYYGTRKMQRAIWMWRLFPAPSPPSSILLEGRTMLHNNLLPSLAPTHQLQQPPSVFPLPTSLEKLPTFPKQILSFAFHLGKVKVQRATSLKAIPKG